MIGLFSVKCLQTIKFKVKCYRCFIKLEFCEFIRKKCNAYPSARICKPKQLNVYTLILFTIARLLLYFSNHILEFLFGFYVSVFQLFPVYQFKKTNKQKKKKQTNKKNLMYRVTVNSLQMEGWQFFKLFIIKVDYLFYFIKLLNRDIYFNFSIFIIIDRYFISQHSWILLT